MQALEFLALVLVNLALTVYLVEKLSLIHISEPTRLLSISFSVFWV